MGFKRPLVRIQSLGPREEQLSCSSLFSVVAAARLYSLSIVLILVPEVFFMDHCCHQNCSGCSGCSGGHKPSEIVLSRPQAAFLSRFAQAPFLPLCRFLMRSSQEDELESVGLDAVFMEDGADLDAVRSTAALLNRLASLGLITLDYDLPLSNYDYTAYETAPLFARFCETVAEGARHPGFLFDTPVLEKGSMALTDLGRAVMEQVLELL